ncbi:hypothetical protein JXA70_04455 [candidate division KSB1 bacterium]|nr:hypothetical protein [candidate division KSB1 bacterium]
MKTKALFVFLVFGILLLQCGKDKGTEPEPVSKIEGTITFSGAWPEAAEDVRVVVGADFPIQSFDDLKMSSTLACDGTVNYSIEVENGDYKFVGVIWKPAGGVWGLASICGVYTMDSDFLTPSRVSVSAEKSVVTGINMTVDRSRTKKLTNAHVSGTISLQGAWPDSFSSAMLVTSAKDLISDPFTLLDLNMGTALERGQTSADYVIATPAGTNRTIGVAFLDKDGRLTQDAVYFAQNNGGLEVKEQTIAVNQSVTGPSFVVKLGSITSGIKGTVSFIGNWPAPAAEVRLITATVFPPAMDELIIGEEISADASNHKYVFYLKPDTYKVVGVVWRAAGTSWDLMSICGAYFAGKDSLAPSEVVLSDDNSFAENINIVVNRSKARKITETYIEGNITFQGEWPADVTEARVIATTKLVLWPPTLPTMLDLAFSDPIPVGTTATSYRMRAFPGQFVAIGVIFLKGDEQLTINDILYSNDVGALAAEEEDAFEVVENAVVSGKDFTVEF